MHLHTKQRREGDEYVCVACCKRWGVDEDAPACVPVKIELPRKFHNHGYKPKRYSK